MECFSHNSEAFAIGNCSERPAETEANTVLLSVCTGILAAYRGGTDRVEKAGVYGLHNCINGRKKQTSATIHRPVGIYGRPFVQEFVRSFDGV